MLTHINTYVIIPNKSTAISVKKRFCAVLFPAKIYRPATHPIILPSVSPDKILRLYCVGGIFFLGKPYLENFISRLNVILCHDLTLSVSEPDNAAAQTGAGTSFGANGDQHTRAAELSTYFCVLTIRKQLSEMRFERSGGEQEPSRGHKFSILENLVLHRDFTSATLASFDVILLGRTCPKPCSWFAPDGANSNGVSCLHNFTEELSNRQEVQ